ncbi:hypothetical protein [uncultured Brevundimonas sp.]|nr:hypothetical protein [uncultured Brevundimonas sp.]
MISTQTVMRAVTMDQVRAPGPTSEDRWVMKANSWAPAAISSHQRS